MTARCVCLVLAAFVAVGLAIPPHDVHRTMTVSTDKGRFELQFAKFSGLISAHSLKEGSKAVQGRAQCPDRFVMGHSGCAGRSVTIRLMKPDSTKPLLDLTVKESTAEGDDGVLGVAAEFCRTVCSTIETRRKCLGQDNPVLSEALVSGERTTIRHVTYNLQLMNRPIRYQVARRAHNIGHLVLSRPTVDIFMSQEVFNDEGRKVLFNTLTAHGDFDKDAVTEHDFGGGKLQWGSGLFLASRLPLLPLDASDTGNANFVFHKYNNFAAFKHGFDAKSDKGVMGALVDVTARLGAPRPTYLFVFNTHTNAWASADVYITSRKAQLREAYAFVHMSVCLAKKQYPDATIGVVLGGDLNADEYIGERGEEFELGKVPPTDLYRLLHPISPSEYHQCRARVDDFGSSPVETVGNNRVCGYSCCMSEASSACGGGQDKPCFGELKGLERLDYILAFDEASLGLKYNAAKVIPKSAYIDNPDHALPSKDWTQSDHAALVMEYTLEPGASWVHTKDPPRLRASQCGNVVQVSEFATPNQQAKYQLAAEEMSAKFGVLQSGVSRVTLVSDSDDGPGWTSTRRVTLFANGVILLDNMKGNSVKKMMLSAELLAKDPDNRERAMGVIESSQESAGRFSLNTAFGVVWFAGGVESQILEQGISMMIVSAISPVDLPSCYVQGKIKSSSFESKGYLYMFRSGNLFFIEESGASLTQLGLLESISAAEDGVRYKSTRYSDTKDVRADTACIRSLLREGAAKLNDDASILLGATYMEDSEKLDGELSEEDRMDEAGENAPLIAGEDYEIVPDDGLARCDVGTAGQREGVRDDGDTLLSPTFFSDSSSSGPDYDAIAADGHPYGGPSVDYALSSVSGDEME